MENGFVHIYCGDGKGKTTAAVGLAVRMAGSGGRVLFFQFLKNNSSSERKILENTENIELLAGADKVKFTFRMTEEEKTAARTFYAEKIEKIQDMCQSGSYDMVVLDEAIGAVEKGIADKDAVLSLIKLLKGKTEVVMTGRNPCAEMIELADYVTEMKKIKHPFDRGIKGRFGIEF